MHTEAIGWTRDQRVRLLDQTRLPDEVVHVEIDTIPAMVEAIKQLRVRGAPLIGIAGAMGLAAASSRARREGELGDTLSDITTWLEAAADELARARPTAVNLRWAVEAVRDAAIRAAEAGVPDSAGDRVVEVLRREAQRIWDEDATMCDAIGRAGAGLVPQDAQILTVCNTGMLATGGIGTAFGVIRIAHEQGRVARVFACETRPLRQGARLTAWELARCGIPGTVIVDSAAASVMRNQPVSLVVAGADRIAANGDSANKIGTYSLAVLADAHGIPFYIAAPRSTVDLTAATGSEIPIEERDPAEIDFAAGVDGYNPAFDVTPAGLIAGIITDAGVLGAPYDSGISQALNGVKV
jgi:methylthioribose-1-phosphate isomerase